MDDLQTMAAIRRLKQGDIGGLGLLVEHYQVRAVRTAYLVTYDRALAEDVVQAAFLRVYERIAQFDDSRPFSPWFTRIVVNSALQAAKKRHRLVSLDTEFNGDNGNSNDTNFADFLSDASGNPESIAESRELIQAVREALAMLTPDQRAVIVLRYYLGYSEGELSDE